MGTTWVNLVDQRASIQLIETENQSADLVRGLRDQWRAQRRRQSLGNPYRSAADHSDTNRREPTTASSEGKSRTLCTSGSRSLYDGERGPDSTRNAQSLFGKALELDANSVAALQGLAQTNLVQALSGWIPAEQLPSVLIEAGGAVERFVELDPRNTAGHCLRALLSRALGNMDKAIASLEYALSLNPNYYFAHAELGRAKIEVGNAQETIGHIEKALELIPPETSIHILYFYAGIAALHISDDQAAVQWLVKARANPAFDLSALWLAAAYLGIGEEEAARPNLAEYLREHPKFSIASFKRFVPVGNPIVAKQRERIMDAWRRLGVPESYGRSKSMTQVAKAS